MAKSLWVTVYATEWTQCVPVDRVEWTNSTLVGYRGEKQVVYINVAAVNAVFVSEQKQGGKTAGGDGGGK